MRQVRGRPAFTPTDENRRLVETLVACGVRQDVICSFIQDGQGKPISEPTLRKHFGEALAHGKSKANAAVAQSLFKNAMQGNTTAQIFWLKTQAGWKETPQRHEHSGPEGAPVPIDLRTVDGDQLRALLSLLEAIGSGGSPQPACAGGTP